jgi:hypothetical protein
MMQGLEVVFVILVVVGVAWWRLGGKRKVMRKMEYDTEQRKAKIEEEDRIWREEQDRKRNS